MIGRRKQLEFLSERLRAAIQGQGSVILIEGDAGSGKTRLLREFSKSIDTGQVDYLVGQCFEYARAPFGPIIPAIQALLASVTDPEPAPNPLVSRLAAGPAAERAFQGADEFEKLKYFDALAEVLRHAPLQACVAVMEDIQWADAASLEFLQHVARSMGSARVCIVCTYRSDEVRRGKPLHSVLGRLEREPAVWRMQLDPLTRSEMQALVAETLAGRISVSPQLVKAVEDQAEGNPLFAEELLRNALSAGRESTATAELPRSIREAVLERLSQLEPRDRQLIIEASAIGRRFTPEFLATITERPIGDVVHAIKSAMELQLLDGDARKEHVGFRHALTREAAYSALLRAEARALHQKIGEAIEASPDAANRTAELAYQWRSADHRAKAARYNELAGDAAEDLYASQDAAIYYEHALQATESSSPRIGFLQRKLATALHRSGFLSRAKAAYESAISDLLAIHEEEEAASTLLSLARLNWTLANPARHLAATRRAIELVGDRKDSSLWFPARVEMAWAQHLSRPEEALRFLDEAGALGIEPSARERIKAYECRALIDIPHGRVAEALRHAQLAEQAALDAGDVASAVRCLGNIGLTAAQCGERVLSDDAFARAARLIENERALGWPMPWALALKAYAQFLWGRLSAAREDIGRALSAIVDIPSLDVLVAWVALPVGLRLEDNALVQRCADESLIDYAFGSESTLVGDVASAFSEYYLATGRPLDATRLLNRAVDTLEVAPPPGDFDSALVLVARYCDSERIARARELLRQMAQSFNVRSIPAYGALIEAWSAQRAGQEHETVERALEAAQLFAALEWPLFQAQSLELAGRPQEALEIYKAVGDCLDVNRLQNTLSPTNKRGRRKEELSPRESQIANRVVEGRSNKEIAEELVLSERTVESHVSAILSKLGVGSRKELAGHLKASAVKSAKSP